MEESQVQYSNHLGVKMEAYRNLISIIDLFEIEYNIMIVYFKLKSIIQTENVERMFRLFKKGKLYVAYANLLTNTSFVFCYIFTAK